MRPKLVSVEVAPDRDLPKVIANGFGKDLHYEKSTDIRRVTVFFAGVTPARYAGSR